MLKRPKGPRSETASPCSTTRPTARALSRQVNSVRELGPTRRSLSGSGSRSTASAASGRTSVSASASPPR
ncbi:MAG: hypothetical protein IPG81_07065 [Sandaracinaceae bacterium]|nr:hypothetical protein [Sandaracinaceae bacterium]